MDSKSQGYDFRGDTTGVIAKTVLENITLLDLIDNYELQQIQDVYAETLGIATIITDLDGCPITQPSNFSKVCIMVRATEKGFANCMYSGKVLGAKAHQLRRPTYQKCLSCGFIDASAPIIVDGQHIANWVIGQINPHEIDAELIRAYAWEIGADPSQMVDALSEPRGMSLAHFEKVLRLLWLLAQKISTMAYTNLLLSRDNLKLSQAEKEIKKLNLALESRVWEFETANEDLQQALARLQETQEHLIQQEKLASLGSLVAGIAHEINTPVGTGVTAASYLEQETQTILNQFRNNSLKKSELDNYISAARDATSIILLNLRRASELISSFKQVAVDRSSDSKQNFNLKKYIGAVLLSLRPQLKKTDHAIIINCDEYLDLHSYPGDFSHIITNLIINSLIHAFPAGTKGTITIDVSIISDKLTLIYHDDGVGIPHHHLSKIFEPFFTTRRGQGGTGLGLNIIYNIVTQNLKGSIICTSQQGKGVTFTIFIPIRDGGTL
ncbi:Adaptive-response sensory-kinase SasA [bioreactor metagenome]|uniref:Adaptive-response sensory-kinase SasA n=1 Tax=bioreactor metagenome TaxID=1076179 RepID=A0A644UE08_9ZZZZ|nr:PocR ligand-binding domain-containing protein [Negativicutes bacterium]